MASAHRMNRLLQGDVGAGKTLVALLAMLAAVEAGGQAAMMAPTEILARQHLLSLAPLAEAAGVRLEILPAATRARERAAKLAALAAGEIEIVVGTHALFQKDVAFRDLRLAVVDEQHRFGVRQRMDLGEKGARRRHPGDDRDADPAQPRRWPSTATWTSRSSTRSRPAGSRSRPRSSPSGRTARGGRAPPPRHRRRPAGLLGLPAGRRVARSPR